MYEMITGNPPFDGDQITLMNNHLNKKPQPFRKVNKKLKTSKCLENIVFMCLEKNKNKRPQSIDELKSLLQKAKSSNPKFKNPTKISTSVIILSILAIPLALYIFYSSNKNEKNTPATNSIVYFHDVHRETNMSQRSVNDYENGIARSEAAHQPSIKEESETNRLMDLMTEPNWLSAGSFISRNPILLGINPERTKEIIRSAQDNIMREAYNYNKSMNHDNGLGIFSEGINEQKKQSQLIKQDTSNNPSNNKELSKNISTSNDNTTNKSDNVDNGEIHNELQNNTNTKKTTMISQNIKESNLSDKDDEKVINNHQYPDKIVDNIQKYDINKSTKDAATKSEPKEILKNEIQTWLQEYKKALETGDIETLKMLGHISSKKEENKFQHHYSYVSDVKVSIQHDVIEVNGDNNQVTVSFDRTDEWTDERGSRHKEGLPRISKILRKENNIWKISK